MEFVLGDARSLSAIRTTIRSSSSQCRGHDGRDFRAIESSVSNMSLGTKIIARTGFSRMRALYRDPNRKKNRCDTTECSLRDRELPFALLHDGETIPYLQIGWHFLRFGEYIWRRECDRFRCVVNRENFERERGSNEDTRTLVRVFRLSEPFNFKFIFSN